MNTKELDFGENVLGFEKTWQVGKSYPKSGKNSNRCKTCKLSLPNKFCSKLGPVAERSKSFVT